MNEGTFRTQQLILTFHFTNLCDPEVEMWTANSEKEKKEIYEREETIDPLNFCFNHCSV